MPHSSHHPSESLSASSSRRSNVRVPATIPPWALEGDDDDPPDFSLPGPSQPRGQTPSDDSSIKPERTLAWFTRKAIRSNLYSDAVDNHDDDRMHLHLPLPATALTVSHTQTPGWDTPWAPHAPSKAEDAEPNGKPAPSNALSSFIDRKAIRNFVLTNNYVPLVSHPMLSRVIHANAPQLFRVLNISFTTAALAIAIRIRKIEIPHGLLGAVGSSPSVISPSLACALTHCLSAVCSLSYLRHSHSFMSYGQSTYATSSCHGAPNSYVSQLEYFGRPLGLWRTSAKLMHTLSETLFICAWSAALSLCFDNIFTSPLQCTPISSTRWFSQLEPPVNPITASVGREPEGSLTDQICDLQAALIALVFVGLCSYCANLIISLFRIFEKVKSHTSNLRATR
jgi:hypothetical protein